MIESGEITPDLVLTDVVMPNLDGKALYEKLRLRDDPPLVLFTSGYSASDLRDEELLDPSLPLVPKPWFVDELRARLREMLDGTAASLAVVDDPVA
jgi:DNA-binding response OmpR family regulator